jgi:hypothetical protein
MSKAPRVAKYDGLEVFWPDVSILRPGDILLTLNVESDKRTGLKASRVITWATGGRFSHALICSAPPTFVEAIGSRVSTLSLAKCFAHNIENVRVLRYPDAKIAAKAAEFAQFEIGRDYSVAKAVASVFPQRVLAELADAGIFCSALVAQVFVMAGASSFIGTPVEKTTPNTIDKLSGLDDITSIVFRRILSPMNIEAFSALDGDRVASPAARQSEIFNRYAKALTPEISRIRSSYPEANLRPPRTFFEMIRFVMDAIDSIDTMVPSKMSFFEADVMVLDSQAADLMDTGELLEMFRELIDLEDTSLQRDLEESFQAHPDIDIPAMRSILTTSINQLEQRKKAVETFLNWGPARSRFVACYVNLESCSLSALERRVAILKEILTRVS